MMVVLVDFFTSFILEMFWVLIIYYLLQLFQTFVYKHGNNCSLIQHFFFFIKLKHINLFSEKDPQTPELECNEVQILCYCTKVDFDLYLTSHFLTCTPYIFKMNICTFYSKNSFVTLVLFCVFARAPYQDHKADFSPLLYITQGRHRETQQCKRHNKMSAERDEDLKSNQYLYFYLIKECVYFCNLCQCLFEYVYLSLPQIQGKT